MNQVFIGGTGRSGTTILKRVLACHSKVVSLPDEIRVIVDPDGALDLISALSDSWSPHKADLAIHKFQSMMRACGRSRTVSMVKLEKIEKTLFRKINVAPPSYLGTGLGAHFGYDFYHRRLQQLIGDLCHHVSSGSWLGSHFQLRGIIFETEPRPRQTVEKIVAEYFNDLFVSIGMGERKYWIDDTPYNILYADQLKQLFPDMRLLNIYRDPRDVLASYLRFKWGGDNVESTARKLGGICKRWLDVRQTLPENSFSEVGLEQLSGNPKEGLTKICNFLGLEFEDRLMSIPLDKVHAGRWKKEIPAEKFALVEKHVGAYAALYGY